MESKRSRDIRQLESRLALSPPPPNLGNGCSESVIYRIPLSLHNRHLLPTPLLHVNLIHLSIPIHYPDIVPIISLPPTVPEPLKRTVEDGWLRFAEGFRGTSSLTALINAFAGNAWRWADESGGDDGEEENQQLSPPEWDEPDDRDEDWDACSSSSSSSSSSESDERSSPNLAAADTNPPRQSGTALSSPGIELSNIALLHVHSLNLRVRCDRCKTFAHLPTLTLPPTPPRSPPTVAVDCEKCGTKLSVGFRPTILHKSSVRFGFFDSSACSVREILPSAFTPQCTCGATLPSPGIKGVVPGQRMTENCRACHGRMSLYIPEFRLLRISPNDIATTPPATIRRKKIPEYTVGNQLPLKGRCKHYRKSTRWFRFSCCSQVFPCDLCHDEQVEPRHKSERANRMICGMCSREQNYRPDDCRFCGNTFVAKKVKSHYWEGGKGTRDKRLMNRNDPRKYKRMGQPVV